MGSDEGSVLVSQNARSLRPLRRLAAAAILLSLVWLVRQIGFDSVSETTAEPTISTPSVAVDASAGMERIEQAFAHRESGVPVTVDATVEKTLRDDSKGDRHQRFLIRLPNGRKLLVAHNIDIAERADVSAGDPIRLRGQFEWNERGGVIHWTHRAPRGDHPGGWLELHGQRIE